MEWSEAEAREIRKYMAATMEQRRKRASLDKIIDFVTGTKTGGIIAVCITFGLFSSQIISTAGSLGISFGQPHQSHSSDSALEAHAEQFAHDDAAPVIGEIQAKQTQIIETQTDIKQLATATKDAFDTFAAEQQKTNEQVAELNGMLQMYMSLRGLNIGSEF